MLTINPNPPFFTGYIQPNGYLDASREAHGLWNYYLCARNTYETHVIDAVVFEGEADATTNFKQLFMSVAQMYGVQPEAMAKCWNMVDRQCEYLELPQLPNEERYRFDRTIIIVRH